MDHATENAKQAPGVTDVYKEKLKQQALPYLPAKLESIEAQRTLLTMIAAPAPHMQICIKRAEESIWPGVQKKEVPAIQAAAQCALQVENLLAITLIENLKLDTYGTEVLLKAWIALDYFAYIINPEYSVHIRKLQTALAETLQKRESAPEAPKPAVQKPVQAPTPDVTAPIPPKPVPGPESKATAPIPQKPAQTAAQNGKAPIQQKPAQPEAKLTTAPVVPNQTAPVTKPASGKKPGLDKKKKILIGIAAAVLVLILAVWISGAPVRETEQAIEDIGHVTMESGEKIEAAEKLYEELSLQNKRKVDNHAKLQGARYTYDKLTAAVQAAVDAIDAIGTVTLESGPKIQNARQAYDALEADGLTSYAADKYDTLLQAEEAYMNLYTQDLYDTAKAQYEEGSYQEALEKYEAILADYPDAEIAELSRYAAADCMRELAVAAMKEGRLQDSMKLFQDLESKYPVVTETLEARQSLEKKLERNRPTNGRKLKTTIDWGYSELTIEAGSTDACVKVISAADESKYALFYVRANESATVKLKDGDYKVRYTTGQYWYGNEEMFGDDASFTEMEGLLSYTTTRSGGYVYYYNRTLTLYTVQGGDVSVNDIDPSDF